MPETPHNQQTVDPNQIPSFDNELAGNPQNPQGEEVHSSQPSFGAYQEPESQVSPLNQEAGAHTLYIPEVGHQSDNASAAHFETSVNQVALQETGVQAPQQESQLAGAPLQGTQMLSQIPTLDEGVQPVRTGTPVISLRNVSKIYPAQPNKPALSDVNIDIYGGEFVFLVGHSGSGKSTFIRMLIRELKPTTGSVLVAGQDLTTMRDWKVPYLRRNIGCVFQDFKLLPKKTAYENVAFALECIGKSKHVIRTQVPEVLRLVGLEEKMHMLPDELSGGEQQRVSVARAFVNRPPLLVCDEPTGNLDPAISLGIMKLLERINRTGTTVVVATHDREMVDSMRRRVIALENGQVIRDEENGVYGGYGAF